VKYADFPPAMRPVPHSQQLPVPKLAEYLTFSDDKSDSGEEDQGQQEGDNIRRDPTFEALLLI
jgi:hypothetical protein